MILIRFIFILCACSVNAQLIANPRAVPKPLSIHHDNVHQLINGIDLSPFTDIKVDHCNSFSIDEVSRSTDFISLDSFKFDSKYVRGRYSYWMRFSIENTYADSIQFSFFCGNFDSLQLFKETMLADQFGKMVKSNRLQKNQSILVNASSIQLSAYESSVFFVRIKNTPGIPRYIGPVIMSEKTLLLDLLIAHNDRWYILYFELGALLIMIVYFLTQLYLKRSKLLFYYTTYLIFMLIHLSRNILMSHPTAQFYPPGFYDYFYYAIVTMAVLLSYIQFIKHAIVNICPKETQFKKILDASIIGACLWFMLDRVLLFHDYTVAWKFSNIFHLLSMIFYFSISIKLLKLKHAILSIIACGTLILNSYFLLLILLKIIYPYTDSLIGSWINPATCLIVLIELFLFIIAIRKMEALDSLKTKAVLKTLTIEKKALLDAVSSSNIERRHEEGQRFLDSINDLITKNMDNSQFNATQLYHLLGTNHVSLNKKLKELTAMSTHQYIQHKKLEYSKQLVLNSDQSFSEIAYLIGISDSTYFSKVFKKKFGQSPSSFRKQLEMQTQFQNLPS